MNAGSAKAHPAKIRFMVPDACFCIVAARFNAEIVDGLLDGACSTLMRCDVVESAIDIVRVPGAFELPLAVQRVARSGRYDGIIALAAVIRGDTPHFEYVSDACVGGLTRVALELDVPVGLGVLTVNTADQATERAGANDANKGSEAALAAMEMVGLFRELVI